MATIAPFAAFVRQAQPFTVRHALGNAGCEDQWNMAHAALGIVLRHAQLEFKLGAAIGVFD